MPLTLFAPSPWTNDYFTIGHDLIVLLLRVCMTLLADSDSDLCRLSRNTLAIAGRSTWSANKTGLVLRWGSGNETRFSPNMLIRPYMFLRERIEFFPIVRRCSIKYWIAQPPIWSCIGAAAHICMIGKIRDGSKRSLLAQCCHTCNSIASNGLSNASSFP